MDDKLKERLSKLKNLAERGVGGEKQTAEHKFNQLLKANGLSEDDLVEDSVHYFLFSYKYPYRMKLLSQVIYKVLGKEGFVPYHSPGTRNRIGIYCTSAQKLEIDLEFEFYSNLFDSELSVLMSAFISKQDIYPKDTEVSVIPASELTPEDMEKYRKQKLYESNINKRTPSLMIEDKG